MRRSKSFIKTVSENADVTAVAEGLRRVDPEAYRQAASFITERLKQAPWTRTSPLSTRHPTIIRSQSQDSAIKRQAASNRYP
jgi:hypothetical protein